MPDGNLIALVVFAVLSILLGAFNRQLAINMADRFLQFFGWIIPPMLQSHRLLVVVYRVVFISGSVLCAIGVLLTIAPILTTL
jgi:hypothetical protein